MGRKKLSKSYGRKKRYIKYARKHSPAPRWLDIKVFGLGRAITRSVKRFKSRMWRKSKAKL